MRITAIILSILIMVLSCIPCDDVIAQTIRSSNKTEQSQAPRQHDEPGDLDLCSPFCHCACCAVVSMVTPSHSIPL